ncbi:MAG: hypothetical protein AB1547_10695, partial [Thermodesulfobacteriota bacterium]
VYCLAIRPILRARAAEFFRSSEKGSPATPRLDRNALTFCGAIILDGPAKSQAPGLTRRKAGEFCSAAKKAYAPPWDDSGAFRLVAKQSSFGPSDFCSYMQ